jgi:hypothetical protein
MKKKDEILLHTQKVLDEYYKMEDKHIGLPLKTPNHNYWICTGVRNGDKWVRNYIFDLDEVSTYKKTDFFPIPPDKCETGVVVSPKLTLPDYFPKKIDGFDYILGWILRPSNVWSNSEMNTKEKRKFLSRLFLFFE